MVVVPKQSKNNANKRIKTSQKRLLNTLFSCI